MKEKILEQVNAILIDVLDDENIKLTETTTAYDIDEWDSLSNIQLVVAIENHFNIRFTSKEIQIWNNVGDMVNSIAEKTGSTI